MGFNANVRCDFHSGAHGHNVENCMRFKFRVQELINSGAIEFKPVGISRQGDLISTAAKEMNIPFFSSGSTSDRRNTPQFGIPEPPRQHPLLILWSDTERKQQGHIKHPDQGQYQNYQ